MDITDITFDKINTDLQSIVNFFEQLLNEGDYDKAAQAVTEISTILNTSGNIELTDGADQDPDNPDIGRVDNNFHRLYKLLSVEMETSKAGGPKAQKTGTTKNFNDLETIFKDATAQIFKAAEIKSALIQKNPDQSQYLDALQEAMQDVANEIEEIETIKNKYEEIENVLFFDNAVTPAKDRREIISETEKNITILNDIKQKLNAIKSDREWINTHPGTSDATQRSYTENKISSYKQEIKAAVEELNRAGIDVTSLADITEESNCVTSDVAQVAVQTLIDSNTQEVINQLDIIRDLLEEAKLLGKTITIKDKDGNDINIDIKDEEVIKNLPDKYIYLSSNISGLNEYTDPKQSEAIAKMKDIITEISSIKQQAIQRADLSQSLIDTYNQEIAIVAKELEIINKNLDDKQDFIDNMDDDTKSKIQDEKEARFKDARDKFYGDRTARKQYNAAYKRFTQAKVQKTVTLKIEGLELDIQYTGIDYADDDQKAKDLSFMQLESWEERNQRLAAAERFSQEVYQIKFNEAQSNGKTPEECKQIAEEASNAMRTRVYLHYDSTLKVKHDRVANEFKALQQEYNDMCSGSATDAEKQAKQTEIEQKRQEYLQIISIINDGYKRDKDYVDHYNSAHFEARDTVNILKTGGSAMMIKNHQDKPKLIDRVQAIAKVSNPFSKKADGKRHIITTALSSIGGIISLPIRLVETGIGLVAAFGTYAVTKINGTYDRPTPYNISFFDKKEARQEYYMKKGNNPFVAWIKSYFNLSAKDEHGNVIIDSDTGKKRSVNDQIIFERCKLIGESIEDKYVQGAKAKFIIQQEEALKNQRARVAMYKEMVRKNPELYVDLYDSVGLSNHPLYNDDGTINEVALNNIAKRAMARSSAKANGVYDENQTFAVFKRSDDDGRTGNIVEQRNTRTKGKFTQNNPDTATYTINNNIDDSYDYNTVQGETLWTNAISRQNIRRGMTKGVDLGLKIAAAATLPAMKRLFNQIVIKPAHETTIVNDNYIREAQPVMRRLYYYYI